MRTPIDTMYGIFNSSFYLTYIHAFTTHTLQTKSYLPHHKILCPCVGENLANSINHRRITLRSKSG